MKVTIFFNMNGDGLREKELAREALSHIPDILTVSGGRHNLEVSHINSGKGKGLLRLGEILGIDPSRTMGCGDEENDLDLIPAVFASLRSAQSERPLTQAAAYFLYMPDFAGFTWLTFRAPCCSLP